MYKCIDMKNACAVCPILDEGPGNKISFEKLYLGFFFCKLDTSYKITSVRVLLMQNYSFVDVYSF